MPGITLNWDYWEMVWAFSAIESSVTVFRDNSAFLLDREIEKEKAEFDAEEIGDHDEVWFAVENGIRHAYDSLIPNYHSYVAIVMAFSAVEHFLDRLTDVMKSKRDLPINGKTFKGNAIQRLQTFAKVFGFPPMPGSDAQLINETAKLRNCIVHCNGVVKLSSDFKEIERIVASSNGTLDIKPDGQLSIELSKSIEMVGEARRVVASLFEEWGVGAGSQGNRLSDDRNATANKRRSNAETTN